MQAKLIKKIQQYQSADCFIANTGADKLSTHRFCKKPVALDFNEKHCIFLRELTIQLQNKSANRLSMMSAIYLRRANIGANSASLAFISYSIDAQVIVNMTVDILKPKKIANPVATQRQSQQIIFN